ncbi:MAG: hypothetical protein ACPGQR_06785, partial [Marinirhabdus sp.]
NKKTNYSISKLVGEWTENKFVKGEWIIPNGTLFRGKFENNKPNGEGEWVLKNGNILNGLYK